MRKIAQLLLIAGLFCQIQSVHAAGFILAEQSVSSMGTANAANTAAAADATTVYSNPAGMVFLDYCNEIVSGIFTVIPHSKYHDRGTINALAQPFPESSDGGDGGSTGYIPDLAYVKRIGCRCALGLGVNGPFGLVTDWNDRWWGRYYATRSAIESININPSFAFKITDCLSIGAGFNAMYFHAELKNMVDFGLILFQFSSGALGTPEEQDGEAKLKGNTWGYGGNVGLMYQLGCNTRFGVQWRSQTRLNLNKARVKYKDVPAPLQGTFFDTKAKAKITLPDTVSFGLWHRFNRCLSLVADVQWTHWAVLKELRVRFPEGAAALTESVTPLNWDDAWRYAVGLIYDWNCHLTLRAGYAYDQTPTPNAKWRTPRLPDEDRNWVAAGLQYRLNECIAVDFAYAHVFVKNAKINKRDSLAEVPEFQTAGGLIGNVDSYANVVGLSLRYRF